MHGGTQKRGVAHHNFRHGLRSLEMPARVTAAVLAEREDPEALTNMREILLMGARSRELLSRLDEVPSADLLAAALGSIRDARKAFEAGDEAGAIEGLDRAQDRLEKGAEDFAIWGELVNLWDHRRETIESEHRNAYMRTSAVSAKEMHFIVGMILLLLRKFIPNKDDLEQFARELEKRVPLAFDTTSPAIAQRYAEREPPGDDDGERGEGGG